MKSKIKLAGEIHKWPLKKYIMICVVIFSPFTIYSGKAQQNQDIENDISITVDINHTVGAMYPMWANFGYDEPNMTYMKDGKKLLTEISELSPVPVYVRPHNLLTTDEGPRTALKWGSTNTYTEDKDGNPVYDWTIVDKIFDTYVDRGMKPIVEIGFMPKALSSHPEPYRHHWSPDPNSQAPNAHNVHTGVAYPPNDYQKWSELIYQWVKHSIDKYGKKEVESWWWEVWNEPNIGYWQGTTAEYCKLYDYTANAVKRALPMARIGGPATTGPGWDQAAKFLKDFLDHCRDEKNYATGKKGAPLDFISYHAKGQPEIVDGHVRMNMGKELNDVGTGFKIVASYPEFKKLPIIISEADPEGCAACSMEFHPQNAYRNGTMYSSYTASSFSRMYELADQYGVNLDGAVSWSFEFENEPWFAGFRSQASHGIDKPVLNVFRMFGMMDGDRISVNQNQGFSAEEIISDGVRSDQADVNALATQGDDAIYIMVWNYYDDDLQAPAENVSLDVKGIPVDRALLHHYRIDEHHSNAYTIWREMGAPQQVTPEQYKTLENSGQLQQLTSPKWIDVSNEEAPIHFSLPRQGVSMLKISW